MINRNVSRWIWASVSKYFDDNKGSLDFFFEGDDRATDEIPAFCEFRMDGPRIKEVSKDFFDINVYVNILIQAHMNQIGTHHFWQMLGDVQNLFPKCLNVFKYGDGPEDNANVMIGTLKLQYSNPLDQVKTANFGQVDQTVRLQQATVEGRYRMQLTSAIPTIMYLSASNTLEFDGTTSDITKGASSDLGISDGVSVNVSYSQSLEDSILFGEDVNGSITRQLSDVLALVDSASGQLIANPSLSDSIVFVDDADAELIVGDQIFWNRAASSVDIRKSSITGSGPTTITTPGTTDLQGMTVDEVNQRLYFSQSAAAGGTIKRCEFDGSNVTTIATGVGTVIGLAVDPAASKIYIGTTDGTNKIKSLNYDGTGLTDLCSITGSNTVVSVAVDPGNFVYFTQQSGSKIRKVAVGGGSPTDVYTHTVAPIWLTLDVAGGIIYWTDSNAQIHKVSTAGTGHALVIDLPVDAPNDIKYFVGTDKLYFTDQFSTGRVRSVNTDGTGLTTLVTGEGSTINGIAVG